MPKTNHPIEKHVKTLIYKDVNLEVVQRPDVLWVGCLDYASNNEDEPDSNATLNRYQNYMDVVKQDLMNPDWSAALWLNYACSAKPCGMMFAQETYSDNQDERYELFTQPDGLWLRIRRESKTSLALFGEKSIDAWKYFVCGILRSAAEENGYKANLDAHVQIGYDCHAEYAMPPYTCYAYMSICRV